MTPEERKLQALADNRASTQFGGERSPPRSQDTGHKPWSIRSSLKVMAARDLTADDLLTKTENELVLQLLGGKNSRCTAAQMGAARQVVRYAKESAEAAFLTDQIDGKLAQTNLNAEFGALQGMTDEQLIELVTQFQQSLGNHAPDGGGGGDGTAAPAGSEGDVGGEVGRGGAADSPAGV